MSGVMVELRNQQIVTYDCYAATYYVIENMFKEAGQNPLLGLLEKCEGKTGDKFFLTQITLREYRLIDENDHIDPNVKEVAMNAMIIQTKDQWRFVTLTNPAKKFISPPKINNF